MRFEIETDGEIREVLPLIGQDFSITYDREDERRFDYTKKIKDVTFIKQDFIYFLNQELGDDRCVENILRVYGACGPFNDEFLLYQGSFNSSDGTWDHDQCTVKFKVERADAYSCIDDNDEEDDLFDIAQSDQTINLGLTFGTEVLTCCRDGCNPQCDDQVIEDGLWTYYTQKVYVGFVRINFYVRNYLLTPCDYIPSDEWTLLEACIDGQKKYIKRYQNPVGDEDIDYTFLETFDLFDLSQPITQIDNGFKLKDVMERLLAQSCTVDLGIVSDFFQWNPEIETSVNYVTGLQNVFSNIILFQKSDVKRPIVSGNATRAELNFKDLLDAICDIFNLGYKIIDGNLRIEHVSWFQNNFGMDLVSREDSEKYLRGTKKYSYDSTKLPNKEKFALMEAGSDEFIGMDISYDGNCVNSNEESKSETTIDFITTDLIHVMENSDPESENVSDDGFVLVACDSGNNVIYGPNLLNSGTELNNVLAWPYIHDQLYRHGRVIEEGYLNGTLTEFDSVVPTIKQDKFSYVLKCKDIQYFEPLDLIKGSLGWGEIKTAEYFPGRCQMDLDLMLQKITRPSNEITYGDFDDDFSNEFD